MQSQRLAFRVAALGDNLRVYPDPEHKELDAVVHVGGPRLLGVIVLGVASDGAIRKLYADVNWGSPRVRMCRGKLEVVEVWPLYRLKQMGWKPPCRFRGHSLVERVWRADRSGVFKLALTGPAKEEEAGGEDDQATGRVSNRKTRLR